MTRLRAVLFDLDNTLLDTAGVERRRWAHVVPLLRTAHPELDEPTLAARYRSFFEGRREVDLGLRGHDEFRRDRLAYALEPWGRPITPLVREYLTLSNALADTIAPLPGHDRTLQAARSAGLAVGILTNGPSAWQRRCGRRRRDLRRAGRRQARPGGVSPRVRAARRRPGPHGDGRRQRAVRH